MQYRKDRYGNELSVLGFGCMRFQKKNGKIDIDEAEKEIMEAHGYVQVFDSGTITWQWTSDSL